MKQNPYFKESEFACKCGKCKLPDGMPDDELIDALVQIREYFKSPVVINSGYRCPEHNKKIGGAPNSRHTYGDAADITVKGVPTEVVFNYCIKVFGDKPWGIAIKYNKADPYAGFVHLDTRDTQKARWTY